MVTRGLVCARNQPMPRTTRMGKGRLQCDHSPTHGTVRFRCSWERQNPVLRMAETQVSIRIDLESGRRIGPGKIALLEAIRKTGSIKAAGRSMQMSYPKACILVDELNNLLSKPVVTTAAGGAKGGAQLLRQSEKRSSNFTTQSKRTPELPRAANFGLFGN